jgi:hypothetical protein
MLEPVKNIVDDSQYDNWEIYFFFFSVLLCSAIHFEIRLITDLLKGLDTTVVVGEFTFGQILISAFKSILVGIIGGFLYSQGDSFFAFADTEFDSKERAFLVKIGLMSVFGVIISLFLPGIIRNYTDYVVVQMFGMVFVTGYFLIHSEISDWRLLNELPVLVAGTLLFTVPFLR